MAAQWPRKLHGQGEEMAELVWEVQFKNLGFRSGRLEIAHMDGENYTLAITEWTSGDPLVRRYDNREPGVGSGKWICVLSALLSQLEKETWTPPVSSKLGREPVGPPERAPRLPPPIPPGALALDYHHGDAGTGMRGVRISNDGRWVVAEVLAHNFTGQWRNFDGEYRPRSQGSGRAGIWHNRQPLHFLPQFEPPYLFAGNTAIGSFRSAVLFVNLETGKRNGIDVEGLPSRRTGLYKVGDGFLVVGHRTCVHIDRRGAVLAKHEFEAIEPMYSSLSPSRRWLAATSRDREILVLLDLRSGKQRELALGMKGGPVEFSPDGSAVAISGDCVMLVELGRKGAPKIRPLFKSTRDMRIEEAGLAQWMDAAHLVVAHDREADDQSVFRVHRRSGRVVDVKRWPGGPLTEIATARGRVVTVDEANGFGGDDARLLLWNL